MATVHRTIEHVYIIYLELKQSYIDTIILEIKHVACQYYIIKVKQEHVHIIFIEIKTSI